MGRGKKEVEKIEDKSNRQVTFSRRKKGLIKKVYELSVLCDIDIALIMFSPAGRLTQFSGKKRTEEVLNRYLNLTDEEREEVIHNRESWIKILNEIMTNDDKELQLSKPENVNPQFEELQREVDMLQQQLQISEEQLRAFEPYQSLDFKSIEELESMEKTLKNTLEQLLQRKGMLASFENQVTNPTPAPFPQGDLSCTPAYPILRGSSSRMGESCVNDPDLGHFPLWSPSSSHLFPPIQHEVEGPSMIQYEVGGPSKIQYEVGGSSMVEYEVERSYVAEYELRRSSIAEVYDPILYEVEGPSMVKHQVGGPSMIEHEVGGPSLVEYEVRGPSVAKHEVGGGPFAPHVRMATDETSGGEEA